MKSLFLLLSFFFCPIFADADVLSTALDTIITGWTSGGSQAAIQWSVVTDVHYCGTSSLQATAAYDYASVWLKTTLTGPRTLTYYFRYPGSSSDKLSFYDNETYVYDLPGTNYSWVQKTYAIPAGSHALKWNYYEGYDGSVTAIDCVSISNSQPSLQWTGETNYSVAGVLPKVGVTNSTFDFRVKYSDSEWDPPISGYPKLHILKNGTDISGSPISMSYVSGANDTGAIYSYSKVLTSTGTDYTYYFEAQDTYNAIATGAPLNPVNAPDVYKSIISWTGETQYTSGGLSPVSGDRNTNFIFRLKFTDGDNQAPGAGYPKLHIKQGGIEISGSPFVMNYVAGAYNAGAIYSYTKNLMPGTNYTYYFEAQDAIGAATGESPTTEIDAPDVSNQYPSLAWTGETNYINDGVYPKAANSTIPSVFRVKYSDVDNDAPAAGYPKLYVKKGATQIIGSPFSMNCTGTNYVAGAVCNYSLVLVSGDYSYHFEAFDIYNGLASGVPTSETGGLVSIGTDLPAAQEVKVYHGVFKPGQNEKASISFNTIAPVAVTVTVYNNLGRKVKELYSGTSSSGLNLIQWDGKNDSGANASSGVYTIKIEGGGINQTRRVVIIR